MSKKARLILSFFIALGFLIISYWITNLRFPISGEKTLLTQLEVVRDYFFPKEDKVIDSVLFVNVTYDRELCPVRDSDGLAKGREQITDRHKLLKLLRFLKRENNYRYVVLDVFFEKGTRTTWDDSLFSIIKSMPRIVIPCHSDRSIADSSLLMKAGLADYLTTFSESDFVKYPYFSDKKSSMPVKMYEEMTGKKIMKHGFFYTEGWHPVRSSIVLTYELRANQEYEYNDDGRKIKIWNNLGMDLLGDSIPEWNEYGVDALSLISAHAKGKFVKDKYIVIGSFGGDDTHTTFIGDMSGAVLNFNAYVSLLHGHHIVSLTLIVILFVIFYILSFLTLSRRQLKDLFVSMKDSSKNKFVRFSIRILICICTWIGYSTLLAILCVFTYLALGEAYDIFITSTLFSLFGFIVNFIGKILIFIRK